MADVTQDVILSFNADTGGVDKQVADLTKAIEGLSGVIETMSDDFEKSAAAVEDVNDAVKDLNSDSEETGGILSKAAKLGSDGFKMLGTAIAATGLLGLLTKVLEPILAAFLENKTVAGALSAVMAGLGAIINSVVKVGEKLVGVLVDAFQNPQEALDTITEKVNELKDRFFDAFSSPGEMLDSLKEKVIGFADTIKNYVIDKVTALIEGFGLLGKAIGAAFSGDFSEAADLAADGLQKIYIEANPVVDATKAVGNAMLTAASAVGEFASAALSGSVEAFNLDQALGALSDRERELAVQTARSRAEVEELKRQRDDERLSIEERIKFAEQAAAIDQRIADENVAIAEERARLLRQEIALQGETEERLQQLADAEIAAADARGASAGVQTELMTSIYGLNQEAMSIEREVAAMRRGFLTENLEGIEAEKQAVQDQLIADLEAIDQLNVSQEEKERLRVEARQASSNRVAAIDERANQEELKARQDLEDELFALNQSAEDKEILAALQAYDKRVEIAGDDEGLLRMATEQLNKDLSDINATYRAAEEAAEKEQAEKVRGARDQSIQAIADLSEAFGGITVEQERQRAEREQAIQDETYQNGLRLMELERQASMEQDEEKRAQLEAQLREEQYQADLRVYNLELENYNKNRALDEQARKQFEIQKAVSIAQAAIAQGEAAVQAYKSVVGIPVVGPGLAVAAAAAAVAAGAAQIQGIRRQTYQSTAGEAPTPPQRQLQPVGGVPGTEQGGAAGAPQLDLSFLGEGAGTSGPIQAYVLAQDVSTAQQATQKIEDQATL